MITENLSSLNINKMSQEQYERERDAGKLDSNAIYLTPDTDGLFMVGEGEDSVVRIVEPNPEKPEAQPTTKGPGSLALMRYAHADGKNAVALGYNCKSTGQYGFSTGHETEAAGIASATFNFGSHANANYSLAGGFKNTVNGYAAAAFGASNEITEVAEHAFVAGNRNKVNGLDSVAFGAANEVNEQRSFASGQLNKISSPASAAFGDANDIHSGSYNFVAGYKNYIGEGATKSFLFGTNNLSYGENNFAAGENNSFHPGVKRASAFGVSNELYGDSSVAIGSLNINYGLYSLTTGRNNLSEGHYSYIGGVNNKITGHASFGHGSGLNVSGSSQVVFGSWNEADADATVIVGGGGDEENRLNIFTVQKDGTVHVSNSIVIGPPSKASGISVTNTLDAHEACLELSCFGYNSSTVCLSGLSAIKIGSTVLDEEALKSILRLKDVENGDEVNY